MVEYVDSIGDLNWWLSNGIKIGGKVREGLFEIRREVKIDIFYRIS
jgi:hypothetical protein